VEALNVACETIVASHDKVVISYKTKEKKLILMCVTNIFVLEILFQRLNRNMYISTVEICVVSNIYIFCNINKV